MRNRFVHLSAATVLFPLAVVGCSITTHDKGDGKKDDVDIKTPFGSLSVKEDASNVKDTGLSPYPGARIAKEDDDHHHSANVNISSSLFGLKVIAPQIRERLKSVWPQSGLFLPQRNGQVRQSYRLHRRLQHEFSPPR